MDEDLISSLTRQIREDVIQNYLTERRLIGLQAEDLGQRADETRTQAQKTGRRLNRLVHLMIHPEMVRKLYALLNIPQPSYWNDCSQDNFSRGVRFIRVRAFRERVRFRKLILEAYHRLITWMNKYRKVCDELEADCRAVNLNIDKFHNNYDLLAILGFLRSLDTVALERKYMMGENFTAEEMASVDRNLYIPLVNFEKLAIPKALTLPKEDAVEHELSALADEIYHRYENKARWLMM
ncbi:MAG TPA: hypothetical protein DCZ69_19245 [Syntrophobacteraceae bacterium]|nr:hypothetical protein [Syntrophobacteraceae bacterium]